ncbi:MAG: CBS domain-containing protein [bacterium]
MAKTVKPVLNILRKRLRSIKAKDIMTKKVTAIKEDAKLADVAEILIDERISGLPVVGKKGKITGLITANDLFLVMDMIKEGDIVQNGSKSGGHPRVKFAMSSDVTCVGKNTSLDEIFSIMQCKNVHTIPVVEGRKMVGIVGMRDVCKKFYAIVKDLF